MSRTANRVQAGGLPELPAHPELLRSDLRAWAGEPVAQAGRREALLGRVELLRLAPSGRRLEARVRGHGPQPYRAQVWVEDGMLATRCTCSADARGTCKHAVAALETLRFPLTAPPRDTRRRRGPAGRGRGRVIQAAASTGYLLFGGADRTLTREERVTAAAAEERAQRRQRARRERVAVVAEPWNGGPARFRVAERGSAAWRVVALRGATGGTAACGCRDFTRNELGTCRHVERVRLWLLRKRKEFPGNLLSLSVQPRSWLLEPPDALREVRLDLPAGAPPATLQAQFDSDGWLRPPPPDHDRASWTERAITAAAAVAASAGFAFDLDPGVPARVAAARDEALRAERLGALGIGTPSWRRIVDGIGFRLHAYQQQGALFLARKGRALLADDMGLGKTVQAVAAALLLREEAGAERALVVCPASLKHQWRREIEKACGETAIVVDGPGEARRTAYAGWRRGFLILNYELLLRDLDALRATEPHLVILDEAQRIKNWDTKTARAAKRLASPYAFILTGTPFENRLLELHSLVELLHPRALGPRWRLTPFHAVVGAEGRVIAYEGLEVLRRRLGEFFLRRERREVNDQLPERTENTFWTGLTPLQRRPYRRCASTIGAILAHGPRIGPAELRALLQALTTMRILCNAHAQYDWDRVAPRLALPDPPTRAEVRALGSPKLEEFARVLEDLLDDSDSKIVVFSQWERMLRLAEFVVREPLGRRELQSALFHGGLGVRERERLLERFRTDPELHVLFSTDAGGLGLNLQDTASIVIQLEVPWNPAALEQRIARVHRMGQRRSVQVLHFVTRGALEERVRQVVESKRALFEGLLAGDADRVDLDPARRDSLVQQMRALLEPTAASSAGPAL